MHPHQDLRAWGGKETQAWKAISSLCSFNLKLCSKTTQRSLCNLGSIFFFFPERALSYLIHRFCGLRTFPYSHFSPIWSSLCVLSRLLSLKHCSLHSLCFSSADRRVCVILSARAESLFSDGREEGFILGCFHFSHGLPHYRPGNLKVRLIVCFGFVFQNFVSFLHQFPSSILQHVGSWLFLFSLCSRLFWFKIILLKM